MPKSSKKKRKKKKIKLRPESHDQVFCSIFLHQSCERSRKFMFHYCGHLSAILINSRVRMKIRVQKVLLSFCGEIEPSFIWPASFLKPPFSTMKTKLLAVFLNIFSSRIQNKNRGNQRKNKCVTIIKKKFCKKLYRI